MTPDTPAPKFCEGCFQPTSLPHMEYCPVVAVQKADTPAPTPERVEELLALTEGGLESLGAGYTVGITAGGLVSLCRSWLAMREEVERLRKLCVVRVLCGKCGRRYTYNRADDPKGEKASQEHDRSCHE